MTHQSPVFTQKSWSLNDLFANKEEIEAAFHRVDALTGAFESRLPGLTPGIDAAEFLDLVRQLEAISTDMARLEGYAGLWFSADTQNQAAQVLVARANQFSAQTENRTLPFELWWKGLPDVDAARLMAAAGDYCYWLEMMRRARPYTLSEAEEKVINIKDTTGADALQRLYDSLTSRYLFSVEVDGEVKSLTRDSLMVYAHHPDSGLRARAYQELYRVYGHDGPILGQMYQTLVRDWRNEHIGLRGYPSPIAPRNLDNDIPDEVVDVLLKECRENADVFHRFFRLKARLLGVDRLRRYDIYAPVVAADKTYAFEQAAEMVLASFARFDSALSDLARQVFAEDRLDSEVRPGKRGGAFCWSVAPKLTPWVLTNYNGRARDIATLAHELGHAVHAMLAAEHSAFTYQASLPLAETASTFGEMLLLDDWLAQEDDEAVRRDLLFAQMDENYATIMRQAFFALFEQQAHEMVEAGATVDELRQAYLENLRAQFGDSIDLSDEFGWEWVSIPHIYHTPFYVYAYSFGQLLVLSLYARYRQEGDSFKCRYFDILRAGGADSPANILRAAGVDIARADFWRGGFDVLRQMLQRLEQEARA